MKNTQVRNAMTMHTVQIDSVMESLKRRGLRDLARNLEKVNASICQLRDEVAPLPPEKQAEYDALVNQHNERVGTSPAYQSPQPSIDIIT